jgi:hypothetical protein
MPRETEKVALYAILGGLEGIRPEDRRAKDGFLRVVGLWGGAFGLPVGERDRLAQWAPALPAASCAAYSALRLSRMRSCSASISSTVGM